MNKTHTLNSTESLHSYWWLFLILGIFTMTYQFMSDRSLWLDEASLALNIQERSFTGLLQPLDYEQAAPVVFLLISKAAVLLLGESEHVLRLFPYLMGLATLLLFYWVVKRVAPQSLFLGFALIATSPLHIRYAGEFKQYMLDAALSLLVIGLALRILDQPTRYRIGLLAIVGAAAVWCSHPIIFVLAGAGIVLLMYVLQRRDWENIRCLILMGIVQLGSFLLVYRFFYTSVARESPLAEFMNEYWHEAFLRPNATSILNALFELVMWTSGIYQPMLFFLVIFGIVIGIRRIRPEHLALFLLPVLLMFIASLLELYPLRNRFILFILPSVIIITAVGWSHVLAQIGRQHQIISRVLLAGLTVLLVMRIQVPQQLNETRFVFEWIADHGGTNDVILTCGRTSRIATYYRFPHTLFTPDLPVSGRIWLVDASQQYQLLDKERVPQYRHYDLFTSVKVYCISADEEACPPEEVINRQG